MHSESDSENDRLLGAQDIDQGIELAPILSDDPGWLKVALVGPRARFSLRVAPGNIAVLNEAAAVVLPTRIGDVYTSDDLKILCLGPDEWLVICLPVRAGRLVQDLAAQDHGPPFSLVDISHRNVALSLSGPATVSLLNAGCPRDLSVAAFPVGRCTRTVFEHAQIVLLREGETQFHVEIWRSFAPYLATYFTRVAQGLRGLEGRC